MSRSALIRFPFPYLFLGELRVARQHHLKASAHRTDHDLSVATSQNSGNFTRSRGELGESFLKRKEPCERRGAIGAAATPAIRSDFASREPRRDATSIAWPNSRSKATTQTQWTQFERFSHAASRESAELSFWPGEQLGAATASLTSSAIFPTMATASTLTDAPPKNAPTLNVRRLRGQTLLHGFFLT